MRRTSQNDSANVTPHLCDTKAGTQRSSRISPHIMAYSYPHSRSSRDPRQSSWHFRRDTTLDGLPPDRDIKDGLNKSNPVDTLSIHPVTNERPTTTSSTALEHLEYIGSYNWTNASDAAEIIVPGKIFLTYSSLVSLTSDAKRLSTRVD